jgi:Cys-tRNA(Pro) deacylase
MGKKQPTTRAIHALRRAGVVHGLHPYPYTHNSGARGAASALGLHPRQVIKTLVMQTPDKKPLLVLMHGDEAVSTRALARALAVKSVAPCEPRDAERHTGYQTGGISPFGTRKKMPIVAQATIMALPELWINGGRRGLLVSMTPEMLSSALDPILAEIRQGPDPAP